MHGIPLRKEAPIHEMEPARLKIVEAILFLVEEASNRNCTLTQYDIVKSLFLADKSHLNRYGRPITFDNYVAMQNGPVPKYGYNLLKEMVDLKVLGLDALPWDRVKDAHPNPKACIYVNPKRAVSDDILSETDVDALRDALTTVMSLTFGQIRRLTHEDPAYIEAWGEGESQNPPISYGMLFEAPDFDEAEHLQFVSKHR